MRLRRSLGIALVRAVARVRRTLPAPPPPAPRVELAAVQRRLELVLSALHDRPMTIEPTDRPPRGRLRRWIAERRAMRAPSLAGTDGASIILPPLLPGGEDAVTRYRLLALEQAERIARGTVAHVPASPLARDLYLIAEGAAVDRALSRGGTRALLDSARASALENRPPIELMPLLERSVETLVRDALAGRTETLPASASPADSRRWAEETAARLAAADASRYGGVPPVALWGAPRASTSKDTGGASSIAPSVDLAGAASREGAEGERRNSADALASTAQTSGDPGDAAPSAAREPSADDVGDPLPQRGVPAGTTTVDTEYPEWDGAAQRHRPRAVTVRQWRAEEGDVAWGRDVLREHAGLVRRVRQRFERLRAERVRLLRQRDGEELDLAACVGAAVDRRLGHSVDDRLYTSVRPARRGLAIALLVDVSGSTDTPVSDTRQVIDVERTAVLLACEALEALGDPFAVFAFSSRGARRVWMRTVKDFAERHGDPVRRRIAALEPEANTRLGAAVRHTTALLSRQPAGHRLLLIVSDGRPNDVDHYQEQFAVEDSRQAMAEAREAGVHPFCLTVDREQSDYLARIFGPTGYTIMRQADSLPAALLKGVTDLVG